VQVEKVQSIGATISYLGQRVWGVANLTGPVVVGCVSTTKTFRLSPELQLLELPAGCGVETAEWAIPATLHGNRAAVIEPVRHPINKQVTKFTTRESQKLKEKKISDGAKLSFLSLLVSIDLDTARTWFFIISFSTIELNQFLYANKLDKNYGNSIKKY